MTDETFEVVICGDEMSKADADEVAERLTDSGLREQAVSIRPVGGESDE